MWAVAAQQLDRSLYSLVRVLFGFKPGAVELPRESGLGLAQAAAPPIPEMRLEPLPHPRWALPGSTAHRFLFSAPLPGSVPEDTVHGRLVCTDRGAGWVIIVPGYLIGMFGLGFGPFWTHHARAVCAAGLNAAIIAPPLHLGRHPPEARSGELLYTANVHRTTRAMEQAVVEVCALGRWLRRQYGRPVGLWGTSLGGAIAGLAATAWDGWDCTILMQPLDDLPEVLWQTPAARELCAELLRRGVDKRRYAEMYGYLLPSRRRPRLATERILFIIPRYDGIIPAHLQERFWQAWGESERMDVNLGHLTAVAARGPVSRAVDHALRWLR